MNWIAAFLAWLLSLLTPAPAADLEHPRAAAAVLAARASMERDARPPRPEPDPEPAACTKCSGSGWIRIDATTRRRCDCQAAK